jgi:acid phosphatase family membrane protein YuiD
LMKGEVFYDIVNNKVFIAPCVAWLVAQTLKMLITLVREREFRPSLMVTSGGMPSSHSALVSALATAAAMIDGFGSQVFAVSAILALVVMYDSAGVRKSVGQQAAVLNRMLQEFRARRTIPLAEMEQDLKELVGHTSFQVIIGCIVGIIIAWLWIIL